MKKATGQVYGYIVSVDFFGEAQVMPLKSVLADIRHRLQAASVWLPNVNQIDAYKQSIQEQTLLSSSVALPLSNQDNIAQHQVLAYNDAQRTNIHTILELIDTVDTLARKVYLHTKAVINGESNRVLESSSVTTRRFHLALRHLRVEIADPDSALHLAEYVRRKNRVEVLLKDSESLLGQIDTALAGTQDWVSGEFSEWSSQLEEHTRNINRFLDTIQLASQPKRHAPIVEDNQLSLENIKDKVDAILSRMYARDKHSVGRWQEFKFELEKEGFSAKVLQKHEV